ncbi:MAG: hypothetical protein VW942_01210 [Aquiluna sp.]
MPNLNAISLLVRPDETMNMISRSRPLRILNLSTIDFDESRLNVSDGAARRSRASLIAVAIN